MTDDHARKAVSIYDTTFFHTPNIDRIGQEDIVFRNAFVTNSVCGPSRAVLLTGKYTAAKTCQGGNTCATSKIIWAVLSLWMKILAADSITQKKSDNWTTPLSCTRPIRDEHGWYDKRFIYELSLSKPLLMRTGRSKGNRKFYFLGLLYHQWFVKNHAATAA